MEQITTSAAHTPGPWRFDFSRCPDVYDGADHLAVLGDPETGLGTIIADIEPSVGKATALANARLIAAAPDLLHALKFALESGDEQEALRIAEAAVAKAEGG